MLPKPTGLAASIALALVFAAPLAGQAAPGASRTRPTAGSAEGSEHDVTRARAATEAFRSLDRAVASGYQRDGGRCLDHPPDGAMGYHHMNPALLDATLDIERPEILVYERLPTGEYRLNGVEYVVPFTAWPATSEPPVVMGQPLRRAASLELWYRHVWIWRENPSGLFADWNPLVKC